MTIDRTLPIFAMALALSGAACSGDETTATSSASGGAQASTSTGDVASGGANGGTTGRGGQTASGGQSASGGQTTSSGVTTAGSETGSGRTTGSNGETSAGSGNTSDGNASSGTATSGGTTATTGSSTNGTTGSGGSTTGGRGSTTGADAGAPDGGKPSTEGGAGDGGTYSPGNTPVPSAGCGKPLGMLKTGKYKITSSGSQREYIIDIPANYDMSHPYRLFFAFHWIGSTDDAVANGQVTNGGAANWGYYGLKRMATTANDPAIFVAPQAQGSTWGQQDHAFFDDMYKLFTEELCVDTSRVFATGFSFGAMMTYSLSLNHQKQLRAVVALAAANYNIYDPKDTGEPIAYMGTVGMSDGTCPYVHSDANKQGGKYCALTHAMDNGCTIPANLPTTTVGSKTHLCYDFQGCKVGYPVKMCTFDGVHQAAPYDGASGDNGLTSWIPIESWKFFTQF